MLAETLKKYKIVFEGNIFLSDIEGIIVLEEGIF